MGGQGPLNSSCVRWEMFDALRRSRMSFSVTLLGLHKACSNGELGPRTHRTDTLTVFTRMTPPCSMKSSFCSPKNGVEVPSEQECFSGVRGVVHKPSQVFDLSRVHVQQVFHALRKK